MNQILITEKIYITPELRRKKKIYKINFIISIVLVGILISLYVYAEYDKNKNEDLSQDILAEMEQDGNKNIDNTTISSADDVWVFVLNGSGSDNFVTETVEENQQTEPQSQSQSQPQSQTLKGTYKASNGKVYSTVGKIKIPKLDVNYPILSETTDALLKVSVCKFWGSDPNQVGNLCIAGHNYRNSRFFSKVPTLEVGDIIEIEDLTETTVQYSVFNKFTVDPNDTSCTSQLTNGKKIVTLITCTNDSKQRIVVKAQEL